MENETNTAALSNAFRCIVVLLSLGIVRVPRLSLYNKSYFP